VNQLFWRHRKAYDRLMQTGAQFRDAQAAQLSGKPADVRRPLQARRESLADLSRLAAELLKEASHPPSPDTMRRVTTTLEALSTLSDIPDAPRGGLLTDDVDPPGFESLAALVPTMAVARREKEQARFFPSSARHRHRPPKLEARRPTRRRRRARAKRRKQRREPQGSALNGRCATRSVRRNRRKPI
jgi:hypothetical protein